MPNSSSSSSKPLLGRIAWISGGCSGIGLATAELFAKQGCAVFVCDMELKVLPSHFDHA